MPPRPAPWGSSGSIASGQIVAFEEKPKPDRLEEIGRSIPAGGVFAGHTGQAVHRVDGRLRVLARGPARNPERRPPRRISDARSFRPRLASTSVNPYLFRGYWADVGTVASFYEANILLTRPDAPFNFYDPDRPIYTHPRFLPGSRLSECTIRDSIVAEGCYLDRCTIEDSIIGIRTSVQQGTTIRRSVLLGADVYEADQAAPPRGDAPRLGIGQDVVLDRVIVDKNARIGDGARLVNADRRAGSRRRWLLHPQRRHRRAQGRRDSTAGRSCRRRA